MNDAKSKFERRVPTTLDRRVYHCALDDTIDVLEEINRKAAGLRSIFDVEVMALLKRFHEDYGATFSLYLFYEKLDGFDLSQMTDQFADQWRANSDWLKMSFHSRTKKPGVVDYYLYDRADYETARKDFLDIKREILRFAGPECWDNYPRTHFWSGTRDAVSAWRDCGVDGLFYSYPGFAAMYFDQTQLEGLWQKDFWFDDDMDMLFITTNVKLPCLSIDEINQNLTGLTDRKIIEIFADDYNLVELKEHMETAIKWATANGFAPAFYENVFSNSAQRANHE
jgi:hypothetical protein